MKRTIGKNVDTKKIGRITLLVMADIVMINLAAFLALYLRYEFDYRELLLSGFLPGVEKYAAVNTVCTIAVFAYMKLYNSLWRFAGVDELVRIAFASVVAALFQLLGMSLLNSPAPRSFPVLYAMLLGLFIMCVRFSYRFFRREKAAFKRRKSRRTMLIGAGSAGAMALREFSQNEHSQNRVVCIIDDDRGKKGQYLMGVEIVGGREKIEEAARRFGVHEIVFCIPSMPNREKMALFELCRKTGCDIKTLPALYQLANGEVSIKQIRDVQIEDLLGRDVVRVDSAGIGAYIRGKTVLVTGGGGSIGSELCRQVARHRPGKLVIFDEYENNAYDIQQELMGAFPELDVAVLIGSVRDERRIFAVMDKHRPDLVCHAAAHKHVPLMEDSPGEAVKNNVFGTLYTARAASRCGVGRFILISTDKAVNPTSVMGASKRVCEMVVQLMAAQSETEYAAVRFGNVLGSSGSVIPLFRKQIEAGGPVTVTHRNIIRYFMTIPEAVSLVLQAGAYARGGEIFVLDMGEPVRIDDLARNMIRLSGFEPDVDIAVTYTGLRPGEKLFEEILLDGEGMKKTDNDLIYIGREVALDKARFQRQLRALELMGEDDGPRLEALLAEMVPTYRRGANGRESEIAPAERQSEKELLTV